MGFGTEIFFFAGLAALILGPKRLHTVIGQVTRGKARFEEIAQVFKSQISEELDTEHTEKPKLLFSRVKEQIEPSTHHRNRSGEPIAPT